jgi:hypothetical protein
MEKDAFYYCAPTDCRGWMRVKTHTKEIKLFQTPIKKPLLHRSGLSLAIPFNSSKKTPVQFI